MLKVDGVRVEIHVEDDYDLLSEFKFLVLNIFTYLKSELVNEMEKSDSKLMFLADADAFAELMLNQQFQCGLDCARLFEKTEKDVTEKSKPVKNARKNKMMSFRVTEQQYGKLKKIAELSDMSMNEIINQCIEQISSQEE